MTLSLKDLITPFDVTIWA